MRVLPAESEADHTANALDVIAADVGGVGRLCIEIGFGSEVGGEAAAIFERGFLEGCRDGNDALIDGGVVAVEGVPEVEKQARLHPHAVDGEVVLQLKPEA